MGGLKEQVRQTSKATETTLSSTTIGPKMEYQP